MSARVVPTVVGLGRRTAGDDGVGPAVVGLGRRTAGDDGVGPAVVEALRGRAPGGVELLELGEPSGLIALLATRSPMVIVDAVACDGWEPGRVVELAAEGLPPGARSLSTHGVGLAQALALARLLIEPDRLARPIAIVGVAIAAPTAAAPSLHLSPAIAAAVPRAAACVLAWLHARVRGV
ncbi:MAG: hydrogenase maturation protease [Deltaproteobacteria bacterium]|nr:hydrogenase maturation protease [Deltaproteobacteria bacterium]